MKTKIVTIRENTAMVNLSLYLDKSIDELTDTIIECMIGEKLLHDIPEECGELLSTILKEEDRTLIQFTVFCFGFLTPTLLKILKGVQFWGIANDCDDCGNEMREDEEYKECINDGCRCSIKTDNSPDPDMYRDDCK